MKTVLVVCLFTLFALAVTANTNLEEFPSVRIDLTSKVKAKVKELISELPEPIVLSEQNIHPNEHIDVALTGTISNLTGLDVKDFKVGLLGGVSISRFEFVLPKLSVDIKSYDLDGKLGLLHIHGKGQIILNLEDVILEGSAKLGVVTIDEVKYANVKSISAGISLSQDKFNFQITGWLDDEDRSEYMSKLINNIVKYMDVNGKDFIDNKLSSILTTLMADFKIPLKDLISPKLEGSD